MDAYYNKQWREIHKHRAIFQGPLGINMQLGLEEKNGSAMLEYEKRRGFLNELWS